MTALRSVDSLKYGVRLFGYLLAVLVVGGGLLALGLELGYSEATDLAGAGTLDSVETTDLAAGGVLSFLGSFVLLTGLFGIAHKLVADSVARGVAAGTPTSGAVVNETETVTAQGEATTTETKTEGTVPDDTDEPATGSPVASRGAEPAESEPAGDEQGEPEQTAEPTPAPQPADTESREPTLSEMFDESESVEQVEQTEPSPPQNGHTGSSTEENAEPQSTPGEPGSQSTPAGERERRETPPPEEPSSDGESLEQRRDPPREPTPEEIAFGTRSSDDTDETIETADDEREDVAGETEPPSSESTRSVGNSSGKDPLADPGDE